MPALHPRELFQGAAYAVRGMALLRKYPGLARYWSVPIVLTSLALLGSLVLAVRYHDDLLGLLWTEPVRRDALSWLAWGSYWFARALTFVVSLALLALGCIALSTLIAAPFNDALSEAIEFRETGRTAPPFSLPRALADASRTMAFESLKLAGFVLVMGPLWLTTWLLPGLGQVLYAVLGGTITVTYFALDYIDWPASRRGWSIRKRLSLVWQRPLLMLGFGAAVWACLFVPFLNLAFMPIAVAGGTRLVLDLEAEQQRRSTLVG
jgi:CysZ protein